jgi:hypothetical protein
MYRLSIALFLFLLLPSYGRGTEYCSPNYSVEPLPNTWSGRVNSSEEVCFVVENPGPLAFSCSFMAERSVTVNGTRYSASLCSGTVTVPNTNGGEYYFDISAGGNPATSIAFWPGSGPGRANKSCAATLSAGQQWSDRYNLSVNVTGSDNWRVKMTLPSPEVMIATWNIDPYWPPPGNMLIAAPNGKGNNWGVTIKHNGNWTWPTVTCEAFDEPFDRVHTRVDASPMWGLDPGVAEERQTGQSVSEPGYALVGGGAYAEYSGAGAFLTASRPWVVGSGGDKWWDAASQDLVQPDSHTLTTYAIGLRLYGVNSARLDNMISVSSMAFPPVPGGSSRPAGSLGIGSMTLGGGAYTETSGAGQLLTRAMANGSAWDVASKDHLVRSPGWVHGATLTLNTTGIIEGFGALQVRQMKAATSAVQSGVGTSIGQVAPGWSLASLGGEATTSSGLGRMLFRIGTDAAGRTATVQSKDHLSASAGQTTASWIEVRKVPGSHGLCNTGAALLPSMDACVASICAADARCCQTAWDSSCVAKVTSVCGRSCADHTCSIPTYNPGYWNDWDEKGVEGKQWLNNCYNYATNTRTDTTAQPGHASGHYCVGHSGCSGESAAAYATNDGLIPTTLDAGCPDNRALVALAGSDGNFHWYRRDWHPEERRYRWSSKDGYAEATDRDAAGAIITDIEAADRGAYTQFIGYFCTCSSSAEGQGHAEID